LLEPDALHAVSPLVYFPVFLGRDAFSAVLALAVLVLVLLLVLGSIEQCGGPWQAAARFERIVD
jgi:hypothetical protein